jgi:hypothetical protein
MSSLTLLSDIVPLLQAGAWSRRNSRTHDLHLYGHPACNHHHRT